MKFSFSVFGGMETGETGEILLALTQIGDLDVPGVGAYCIRPTGTRPFLASPSSFPAFPSSFLALTQEKKQKKVKAPPGPGKLAGYLWAYVICLYSGCVLRLMYS